MINLLLGAPGGGKSYEAVAFHVIPALSEGRKVITNLPLVLDNFPPEWRRLIELRETTLAPEPDSEPVVHSSSFRFSRPAPEFSKRAFANVEDYGDDWRHPETGAGPLYVIDECHLCLPKVGTPRAVPEWFSLHRHEFADVLLITQSYGKVQRDIIDLVQVCYRVRKASALGFSSKYIRKVFDGVRGECMNENVRTYDKTYFKYYRSHTRSSKAGRELEANDIVPIWKHWSFRGAALLIPLGVGSMIYIATKGDSKPAAAGPAPAPASARMSTPAAVQPASVAKVEALTETVVEKTRGKVHPLAGFGLHVSGVLHNERKTLYMFTVSQNGQAIYSMNQVEMAEAGYQVKGMNDCIVEISYGDVSFHATCDAPRVGVNPAATMPVPKA